MSRITVLLVILLASLAAGDASGPSADEAVVWTRINRHRGDPRVCSFDVSSQVQRGQVPVGERLNPDFHSSDWSKGLSRSKPQPMVCLNPQLSAAARELLKTTPTRNQLIDPLPAMRAAGYAPADAGFALMALNAPSLEVAYIRALARINEVSDVKGRRTYRFDGHRMLLPEWREVGVAVAVAKGGCSVAIVLGKGSAKRYLGGVVYADGNHDGILDPGEGKAGVQVRVGGGSTVTGPGGSWALALADDAACEVEFAGAGGTARRQAAKGSAVIDWRLPDAEDMQAADKLLAAWTAETGKAPERIRKAQVALLLGTRVAILDDARQQQVDAAVGDVRSEYDDALRRLLGQLREEQAVYKGAVAAMVKSWEGALPATWKGKLEALYALGKKVEAAQSGPVEQRAKVVAAVSEPLNKAIAQADDPIILRQLMTWREALAAVDEGAD